MVGHLRVPSCFLSRIPRSSDLPKFTLFSLEKIKKNWSIIPLMLFEGSLFLGVPFFICHRLFFGTIDVQLCGYHRWEIPTVPRFIDLRNPRNFKILSTMKWQPAIHLDNRYRLMRGETMMDADGNETDEIGEDETAPPTIRECIALVEKHGPDYFVKRQKVF